VGGTLSLIPSVIKDSRSGAQQVSPANYHTFVQADPALAENVQNDVDRFPIYLAESSAP
jgi:hypothetical protein